MSFILFRKIRHKVFTLSTVSHAHITEIRQVMYVIYVKYINRLFVCMCAYVVNDQKRTIVENRVDSICRNLELTDIVKRTTSAVWAFDIECIVQ